eukprot:SAG11_NODE_2397_length_3404_cov_1.824508_5_plen_47_part_00
MAHLPRLIEQHILVGADAVRFQTSVDKMNWPTYFQDFGRGLVGCAA